ncbi:uncharacterized protein LOC129592496 isoform X2 [Paramacrobiotus metropolitanus]|uniref:uncharacterized protein LOC129592496 isoform X2 n=1 Tax=Paramacrobiotus metropolitanus TaxID=2943436 RepID=UPI00244628DB|nr:uncharacterized protein LOC129592496 isoform X2 [Paramacrobiotus metropolitanus]
MKLIWLQMTDTLIVSADDVNVTVVCRRRTKRGRMPRLPRKFHRLVFHLHDHFVKRYIRQGGTIRMETWFTKTIQTLRFFPKWLASKSNFAGNLVSKGTSQDYEEVQTLQTLSDIILSEALQSMDKIAQRELKRVCRRWYRLQSSATTEKCVILEAPDRLHNRAAYLAKALLKHTDVSTRSLLLMQFSCSHSSTAMRLLEAMQLQLRFYVSYRSTDTVHWRSQLYNLEDELWWYPAVNNLHVCCCMKSKSGERFTLAPIYFFH